MNLEIPVGLFTCITGVSGSGKSTLINDTLFPLAQNALNRAEKRILRLINPLKAWNILTKWSILTKVPIGRTPRSNPATYTGLFTPIRELFAGVPEARARGYNPGRFSFNVRVVVVKHAKVMAC